MDRKSSMGDFAFVQGVLTLKDTPLIYSVSYFSLGWLGALFGGASPAVPRGDGTGLETESYVSFELFQSRRHCTFANGKINAKYQIEMG